MKILSTANGYLLVRPHQAEALPAGMEVPDSVDREKPRFGTVVIGNRVNVAGADTSTFIAPGASVLFDPVAFLQRTVEVEGEKLILVHTDNVVAIVEL